MSIIGIYLSIAFIVGFLINYKIQLMYENEFIDKTEKYGDKKIYYSALIIISVFWIIFVPIMLYYIKKELER